jgi:hypothetical protein
VLAYLARFPPIDTVSINGVAFVRVYDLRHIPPPEWMHDPGR